MEFSEKGLEIIKVTLTPKGKRLITSTKRKSLARAHEIICEAFGYRSTPSSLIQCNCRVLLGKASRNSEVEKDIVVNKALRKNLIKEIY